MSDQLSYCFLDQAADRIERETDLHLTARKVAALARREQWRTRKIHGLRAVCSEDVDRYIDKRKTLSAEITKAIESARSIK